MFYCTIALLYIDLSFCKLCSDLLYVKFYEESFAKFFALRKVQMSLLQPTNFFKNFLKFEIYTKTGIFQNLNMLKFKSLKPKQSRTFGKL